MSAWGRYPALATAQGVEYADLERGTRSFTSPHSSASLRPLWLSTDCGVLLMYRSSLSLTPSSNIGETDTETKARTGKTRRGRRGQDEAGTVRMLRHDAGAKTRSEASRLMTRTTGGRSGAHPRSGKGVSPVLRRAQRDSSSP